MTNNITHKGIVENIDGSHIRVRIVQASACASCSAKGHCGSAESKEKIVDIYHADSRLHSVGDEVIICGTTSMGMQAVVIAFVIPFVILITVLYASIHFTNGNEAYSALLSLLSLIPYYSIVYLCRHRLKKKFSFTLKTN